MSCDLHDVDLAEVKLLVEKGEIITGLLQEFDVQEQDIETLHGSLHVTLCGTPKGNRPVILIYHDIGVNHKTWYNPLFNSEDTQEITQHFAVYYVDAHLFISAYNSWQDLEIERPMPGTHTVTLQCPALQVVGDNSPAIDAVVECNSKLNPTKTTLLKMADCGGLPQISQPAKLADAFKYFVQGMGYMPSASMTRLMRSRTASRSIVPTLEGPRSHSHTSEDPCCSFHTSEGRSHTSEDACLNITPNLGANGNNAGPKSMEVAY
ncbi:Protein NDRG1 [Cricetulus griseus]|uniref:Protein NDRG1 n=1 Tax=Cricetulus griseus TaxID=10029 RepID=G3IA91_CRIGR|nr:Protein NDRG1 [Cricetulus griseus]